VRMDALSKRNREGDFSAPWPIGPNPRASWSMCFEELQKGNLEALYILCLFCRSREHGGRFLLLFLSAW